METKKHKHQFSKLDVEFKDGDIQSIVVKAERYRELLVQMLENKIKVLDKVLEGDFDKRNYHLRRAYRDGGVHHLKTLKEIIEDV